MMKERVIKGQWRSQAAGPELREAAAAGGLVNGSSGLKIERSVVRDG